MQLTFYLFDKSVTDYNDAISRKKLDGTDSFRQITLSDSVPFEARAYFQRNKASKPRWLNFISPYCNLVNEDQILNTVNSFLMLIKVKGRIFTLTTGFGFTAINRERLERDFGLKFTLNAIDPEKIKNIDVRNIDLVTRQRRTFLNHDSPVAEFELNLDEDMVSLMGGIPKKESGVGKRIFGSDSLSLTADVKFVDLASKCEQLLKWFSKRTYKKSFDFIDQVKPVKDKALIDALEGRLKTAVKSRSTDKITLAYPELEWEKVEKFKISYSHNKIEVEEVSVKAIYDFLDEHSIDEPELDKLRIVGLDGADNAITRASDFHDYVVFETSYNSATYILSLNRWFKVEKNYLKQVQATVDAITDISYRGFLLPIQQGEGEGPYNERVAAAQPGYVCLDRKNFIVPDGRSRIEVCDLFTPNRDMICVKKETKSATLSHLFSQGSVSATLFNDYREYREYLHNQLPNPKPFDVATADNRDFRIVYAITTDSNKRLSEALPFFSKVNLRNHRKTIERLGFKLALCKIPYV
jgi:uncharacterized protein (TIGR04141 family)